MCMRYAISSIRASLTVPVKLAETKKKSNENTGSGRNWARTEPELAVWPVKRIRGPEKLGGRPVLKRVAEGSSVF
jgi:hypothetical protein